MADSEIKNQVASPASPDLAQRIQAHATFCERLGGSRVASFVDSWLERTGQGRTRPLANLALSSRELAVEVGLKYLPLGVDLHFLPWLDRMGGDLYPVPWRKWFYGEILSLFAEEEEALVASAWSSLPASRAMRPLRTEAARPARRIATRTAAVERSARRVSRLVERLERSASGLGMHLHQTAGQRVLSQVPGPVAELVRSAAESQPGIQRAVESLRKTAPRATLAGPGGVDRPMPIEARSDSTRGIWPARILSSEVEPQPALPGRLQRRLESSARSPYPPAMGPVSSFSRMISARPAPSYAMQRLVEQVASGQPEAHRFLAELVGIARRAPERTVQREAAGEWQPGSAIGREGVPTGGTIPGRPLFLDDISIEPDTLRSLTVGLRTLAEQSRKVADRLALVMPAGGEQARLVSRIGRRFSGELLKRRPAGRAADPILADPLGGEMFLPAQGEDLGLGTGGSAEPASWEQLIAQSAFHPIGLPEGFRLDDQMASRLEPELAAALREPRQMRVAPLMSVLLAGLNDFEEQPAAAASKTRLALAAREVQRRVAGAGPVQAAESFTLQQIISGRPIDSTTGKVAPTGAPAAARTWQLFSPAKALSLSLLLGGSPADVARTEAIGQAQRTEERAAQLAQVLTEGRHALRDWERSLPVRQPAEAATTPFGRVVMERAIDGTRAMRVPYLATDSLVQLVAEADKQAISTEEARWRATTPAVARAIQSRTAPLRSVPAASTTGITRAIRPAGIATIHGAIQERAGAVRTPMDLLVSTHRPAVSPIPSRAMQPAAEPLLLRQEALDALRQAVGTEAKGSRRLTAIGILQSEPTVTQRAGRFQLATQGERVLVLPVPEAAGRAGAKREETRPARPGLTWLGSRIIPTVGEALRPAALGDSVVQAYRPEITAGARPDLTVMASAFRLTSQGTPLEPRALRAGWRGVAERAEQQVEKRFVGPEPQERPAMRAGAFFPVMVSLADEWAATIPVQTQVAREVLSPAAAQAVEAAPAVPSRALTLARLMQASRSSVLGAAAAPLARLLGYGARAKEARAVAGEELPGEMPRRSGRAMPLLAGVAIGQVPMAGLQEPAGRGEALSSWVQQRLGETARPLRMGGWTAPFSPAEIFQLVSLVDQAASPEQVSEKLPLQERIERIDRAAQTLVSAEPSGPSLRGASRPAMARVAEAERPALRAYRAAGFPDWKLLDLSDTKVQPFVGGDALHVEAPRGMAGMAVERRAIQPVAERSELARRWGRPFAALSPMPWTGPERAVVRLVAPAPGVPKARFDASGAPAVERPTTPIREIGLAPMPRAARIALPESAERGGTWAGPMRVLQFAAPVRPIRAAERREAVKRVFGAEPFWVPEVTRLRRAAPVTGFTADQVTRELAREGLTTEAIGRAVTQASAPVQHWVEQGAGFPALPGAPRQLTIPAVQRALAGLAPRLMAPGMPAFTLAGLDLAQLAGSGRPVGGEPGVVRSRTEPIETSILRRFDRAGMLDREAPGARAGMRFAPIEREMVAAAMARQQLRQGAGVSGRAGVGRAATGAMGAPADFHREAASHWGWAGLGDLSWLSARMPEGRAPQGREGRARTPDLGWLRRELASIVRFGSTLPLARQLGETPLPRGLAAARSLLDLIDMRQAEPQQGEASAPAPQFTQVAGPLVHPARRASVRPARSRLGQAPVPPRSLEAGRVQGQPMAAERSLVAPAPGPARPPDISIQPLAARTAPASGGRGPERAGIESENDTPKGEELETMAETILSHIRHRIAWERNRWGG
ncbi:MAG: hypothetical protein JW797_10890 [Bradymonadales bacterium]|nr:hypothetical protein [Bradymonadales bacterium]